MLQVVTEQCVCLQEPCSLCDEAKEALDPLRHRVRASFSSLHVFLGCGTLLHHQHLSLSLLISLSISVTLSLSRCLLVSLQFVLQLVDISLPENRTWFDRYRWDIPVFHLNGRFAMKHRVDLILLDKLLQEAETHMTDPLISPQ